MKLKTVLRKILDDRGVTIVHLAKATGVSPQTISNWLAGSKPRDLEQVKKVADYFKISLDELLFAVSPARESKIEAYLDEINMGKFEVVLRKTK